MRKSGGDSLQSHPRPRMTDAERELSSILSEFARTMLTDFPIQEILDRLVTRIVGLLPITGAGVTLIDPSIAPMYIAASDPSAMHFENLQTELGEGPCVVAYRTGAPVMVPDLRAEERFPTSWAGPSSSACGRCSRFRSGRASAASAPSTSTVTRWAASRAEEASTAQTLADVTAAYLVNAQARS